MIAIRTAGPVPTLGASGRLFFILTVEAGVKGSESVEAISCLGAPMSRETSIRPLRAEVMNSDQECLDKQPLTHLS